MVFRVSVPSRGFCLVGKHDLKKSQGDQVSVPSRGFSFLGKHDLEKARVTGSAFLAGAFAPWEKITSKKSNGSLGISSARLRHAISSLKESHQIG